MQSTSRWMLGAAAAAVLASGAHAQSRQDVPVFVDGARMEGDALLLQPVNRTVVPMRALFESLGARVEWDSAERAVYAWKPDGKGVRLPLSRLTAETLEMSASPAPGNWGRVVGTYSLDAPAMLVDRRVYVPLRFAAEALQADVRYAAYRPAVHIRTERVAGYRGEDPLPDERPVERPDAARPDDRDVEPDRDVAPDRPLPRDPEEDRPRRRDDFPRRRDRDVVEDDDFLGQRLSSALDVRLVMPSQRVRTGRLAPVEIIVQNISNRRVTIPFGSEQQFDVEVVRDGRRVWNWAHGRGFAQRLSTLTLEPGEDVAFEVLWDLRDNRGNPVRAGDYLVRGILTSSAGDARLAADRMLTVTR